MNDDSTNPNDPLATDEDIDAIQGGTADTAGTTGTEGTEGTVGTVAKADKPNILAGGFYADDVSAEEIADNNLDPDKLKEDEDLPVTSGELSIGDLDDGEEPEDTSASEDEENMAGGEDNVVSED
jgi:hypothetical protein